MRSELLGSAIRKIADSSRHGLLIGQAVALLAAPCAALAAPAPGQPASTTVTANSPARAYRINPGDELEIYVWGDERLQRSVRVLPDGTFAFPLVGQINAGGRQSSDIETAIANGLKSQYKGEVPQVTVSVKSPSGFQFSVVGKVRSPGTFSPGRYVNLLEGMSLAGGPSEFADMGNVVILRKRGTQTEAIRVRLTSTLKGAPSERDLSPAGMPQLESGDTVIVP